MPQNKRPIICRTILQQTSSLVNSLQGYDGVPDGLDIDRQLPVAFKTIKSCFEENREAISFISFADTELKSKKISDWEVEPDRGQFFYASIQNGYDPKRKNADDFQINDYYFFKSVLADSAARDWYRWSPKQERLLLATPKSAQLAYVLEEAFIYRIICEHAGTAPMIEFDISTKVLSARIPEKWLSFKEKEPIRKDYTPISFDEVQCKYISDPEKTGKHWDYPSSRANVNALKVHIEELSSMIREINVPIKPQNNSKRKDIYADGFSRLILSLAYLSKLMGCWVESIPCAVSIQDEKPRCLGVFIWGYYPKRVMEGTSESPYSIYFRQFADKVCTCFASKYIMPLKNAMETKEKATSAAIAQAMARNMSHNIGSHVMSSLIDDEVHGKLTDGCMKSADRNNYHSCIDPANHIYDKKNRQLAYFNRYLKNRMDYLSEVTFGASTLVTTKMAREDLLGDLDRCRILLNSISGVSDFKYTIEHKFEGELEKETDLGIAVPGDVLGCQAFYNILENIIRNTAKHARHTDDTTFTIRFKEIPPGNEDVDDAERLYCVEIDNGTPEPDIDTLVEDQNRIIDESVLDEYNNLRSHGLGLLEMKASAAFLRQIELKEIDAREYSRKESRNDARDRLNPRKILTAFPSDVRPATVPDKDGKDRQTLKGVLGYRFFVQKPMEILFIGEPGLWGVAAEKERKLLDFGILFKGEKEFRDDLEAGRAFAHQFLIHQDVISDETREVLNPLNDYKTLLPLRRLVFDEAEVEMVKDLFHGVPDREAVIGLKTIAWEKHMKVLGIDTTSIFLNTTGNSEFRNQVIFLNHATETAHTKEHDYRKGETISGKCNEIWIEHVHSQTERKLPHFSELSVPTDSKERDDFIYYLRNLPKMPFIRFELFEAYHHPVIVLDERVQKFANENREGTYSETSGPIPCSRLHASTNVLIPRPLLSPNELNEKSKQEILTFVEEQLRAKSHSSTKAFLLVHYGVLERLFENETDIISRTLYDWSRLALRVVVTSGRGAHSLPLPESVCYANLSSVLNVFNENRLKYLINYLLNQSRRKTREK